MKPEEIFISPHIHYLIKMVIIPNRQTKKFIQTNRGNVLGTLWSTFGIDTISNPGAIRLGNKMKVNTSGVTNQGISVGFELFDGRMFTVAGTRVFKNTANNLITQFVEDASAGAVTTYDADYSDLIVFNSTLVASTASTKIYSKVSNGSGTGAWTDRSGSLSANTPHMMTYFDKFDRLYITNGTKVHSSDISWSIASSAGDYFIDLTTERGTIVGIISTTNDIWLIMNKTTATGETLIRGASILQWDGISSKITKEYRIPASGVLSVIIKNDIPYVMDSGGILRAWTGSEFKEVSRLPFNNALLGQSAVSGNSARFIHPRGMCVTPDDTILMLICNRNLYLTGSTENVNENLPSGIWEYDPDTRSIKHKHPITLLSMSSTSITDYGQNRISKVGSLSYARVPEGTSSGMSSLICGMQIYVDATSTVNAIYIDSPFPTDNAVLPEGQKAGYFVIDWIDSNNLKDAWQKLWVKYRQFLSATDKIVVKYRTRDKIAIEISITWASTTTFTTSTDLSLYTGYEVEGLQGTGSGKCVHISSQSGSGPYTVTVDDTVTGVTNGTAKVRVQNWKKAFTIQNQTDESTIKAITDSISERIQVKVYAEFTGNNEIFELGIVNAPNQQIQ